MSWTLIRKLLPYLLFLGAVLGALWYAYSFGYSVAEARAAADQVEAVRRALLQAEQIQSQNDELADAYERQSAQGREHARVITREVIKYVESHPDNPECFDADGLRILNEAGAGKAAETPGKSPAEMSGDIAGIH